MKVRRVVTGHDARGRAVFVSDEEVEPITAALAPGAQWHHLWGADEKATFPDDGRRPEVTSYFPPLEGFRFDVFTVPPNAQAVLPEDLDLEAALAEFQERLPGLAEYLEPENPGMHTTATLDVGVVVSGEATLELDDGATVTLRAGDTYVMNGARHRWSNHGEVPAVLVITLMGAHHRGVTPA